MALLLARSLVSRSQFQFHTGRRCFNTNKIFKEDNTNKIFKEETEFSDSDGDGDAHADVGMITRGLIRLKDMLERRFTIQYDIPSAGGNLRLKLPPYVRKEDVKLTLKGATIVLQAGYDINKIIKLSNNFNFTPDEIKAKFKDSILTIHFPKDKGEQELDIYFHDPKLPK